MIYLIAACDGTAADHAGVAWVAWITKVVPEEKPGAVSIKVVMVTLLGTSDGNACRTVNRAEGVDSEATKATDELMVVVVASGTCDGVAADAGGGMMGTSTSCDGKAAHMVDEVIGGIYTIPASLGHHDTGWDEVEKTKSDVL